MFVDNLFYFGDSIYRATYPQNCPSTGKLCPFFGAFLVFVVIVQTRRNRDMQFASQMPAANMHFWREKIHCCRAVITGKKCR